MNNKQFEKYFNKLKKSERKKRKKRDKRKKDKFWYLQHEANGLIYKDFLKSKYWLKIRQIVLKKAHYKCLICKGKQDLQVHHNSYKHHFAEHKHLNDLDILCRNCHKEYHETVPDYLGKVQ